ncbi:hypothetical protein D1AOALGA4SA_2347 [Olavius algarvensis Delta 1 endosymbiont]|nr:hypothetical protein D1AOALGA4SA_2347 [Olavius algarvensis Delta 1 endosymbiont]
MGTAHPTSKTQESTRGEIQQYKFNFGISLHLLWIDVQFHHYLCNNRDYWGGKNCFLIERPCMPIVAALQVGCNFGFKQFYLL